MLPLWQAEKILSARQVFNANLVEEAKVVVAAAEQALEAPEAPEAPEKIEEVEDLEIPEIP